MESSTKNRQSRDSLKKMVYRMFKQGILPTEDGVIELKEGWFNVAYHITLDDAREVILKIAPPVNAEVMTYEKGMMRSEVFLMKKAYDMGIPCPRIYGYDDTHELCDADYFFMEKLEGHNFEHVRDHMDKQTQQSIHHHIGSWTKAWNHDESSSYFGYIHAPSLQSSSWKDAFLKMVRAVLDDGAKHDVDLGFDEDVIWKTYLKYSDVLDDVKVPRFVHWDCWDSNVFVQDGRITGILDFERGFYGDPLAEALFRMRNPYQLQGYGKTTFSSREELRIKLYDGYLFLIMIIEDSYRHYPTKDIRNYGFDRFKQCMHDLGSSVM